MLGPAFHRYTDGYRFVKVACDLVEKHGFSAYKAKIYHAMGSVALWTQPIASAIDFMRATFRAAIEAGDLTFACYGLCQPTICLLLRNDSIDGVLDESGIGIDLIRKGH